MKVVADQWSQPISGIRDYIVQTETLRLDVRPRLLNIIVWSHVRFV